MFNLPVSTSIDRHQISPYLFFCHLVNKIALRQRQTCRWLRRTMHSISFHPIVFRIDLHPRHGVVKLHVLLTNVPAAFNGLDTLLESV